jgi:predicted dinucleotide-binding enzyme
MEIKKVGVLGCGLMGAGIAQTAAMAGFETTVLRSRNRSSALLTRERLPLSSRKRRAIACSELLSSPICLIATSSLKPSLKTWTRNRRRIANWTRFVSRKPSSLPTPHRFRSPR